MPFTPDDLQHIHDTWAALQDPCEYDVPGGDCAGGCDCQQFETIMTSQGYHDVCASDPEPSTDYACQVARLANGYEALRFTSIGSYPIVYMTDCGMTLCPCCAAATEDECIERGDALDVTQDVNWEDPDLYCEDCGERIESAYAEDDTDNA